MTSLGNGVTVTILDRLYPIKCPTDQISVLHQAAAHVDALMRRASHGAGGYQPVTSDTLAILAALNLYAELASFKKQRDNYIDSLNQRIAALEHQLSEILVERQEQEQEQEQEA